jgi:DnaJ-class molecular chaperone
MASPYDILGIDPTASDQDIKRAYRALQLQFHPDRNHSPEAADKIRQINEAYAMLSEKRKPADLFHMLFGPEFFQHQQQQQQRLPPPILLHLTISLEQAYHGCTLPLEIQRWIVCDDVGGRMTEIETVYLDVPAGIDDSEIVVLVDKGHVLHEQVKGSVKVKVTIDNTTVFRRSGLDLLYKKTLTLKEALCGFSFEVHHLNGKVLSMNNRQTLIKPRFRKVVSGLGFRRNDAVGALILEFDVEFPDTLTPDQVAVLRDTL